MMLACLVGEELWVYMCVCVCVCLCLCVRDDPMLYTIRWICKCGDGDLK